MIKQCNGRLPFVSYRGNGTPCCWIGRNLGAIPHIKQPLNMRHDDEPEDMGIGVRVWVWVWVEEALVMMTGALSKEGWGSCNGAHC